MIKLKICGLTNLADARYAAGAGADFLGFVQYEASPRYIEPGQAADIISWLYGASVVGVFVNTPFEEVNTICDKAGFDYVQLHGDESLAYCQNIDRPIIKAIRIDSSTSQEQLNSEISEFSEIAEYFLFDTRTREYGGSGKAFDWSVLQSIDLPERSFLAGGLNAANVAAALKLGPFWGVDVSSGVEEKPGQKDFEKIDALVEAIKMEDQ